MRDVPASSLWNYRCICGRKFTNTYGRSGSAYCPKLRCQLTCVAVSPVSTPDALKGDAK